MSVRRSVRRSWRSETGSTRPIGPVSSPSACSPFRPSAVAASTISNADAAGCSASEPVTADGATGTPARASACGNPAAARGTDLTMTAICDHGTPSKRCARRKKSAISVASAPVEAASFAVTDPESVPVQSISQPPGSRLAMPETTRATAGAQRCEDVSVTDGGGAAPGCGASPPSSAAGSAPRKPNTAWLGSPASSVTSAPAASTRTSRAACGSSCCASSTSRTPIRARSAASSSGSAANASRAAPTSSAAPTAGVVACGAAVPTAARSSITCSYLRANWPAAAHSGRPDRLPSRSSCWGSTPRSAHRVNSSRSSAANPAVPKAARSSVGHDVVASGPSCNSPASNSAMVASCSALVTSRGGGPPARCAASRSTANA